MKDRLVAMLVTKGLLNKDLIESVELYMDKWKVSSYTTLLETNMISESSLADCLAELLKVERVFSIDPDDIGSRAFEFLSFRDSHAWTAFPLGFDGNNDDYQVVVADPTNERFIDNISKLVPDRLRILVGESKLVKKAINDYYPVEMQIPNLLTE